MKAITHLLPALAVAAAFAAAPLPAQESSPDKSIVRVNATLQSYSFPRPWEKGAPTPRRGLGALLSDNRVLVTAELCANSTFLELEHPSSGTRAAARIVAIDYEANLAVLEAAGSGGDVFQGLEPLEIDESTVAGDFLEVWQVEDNGDAVSTQVEVIRVNVGRYFLQDAVFLLYQVRGTLQARANSFTLPVVKEGRLAGMLLSYSSQEQTSTIIPSPIIRAFLDNLEEEEYTGFPNLGISIAQTLDESLRAFTGIDGKEGGVFVRNVAKDGSAGLAGVKDGDVILSVDGRAIDARGNYDDPMYGRLSFSHLVRGAAKVGDVVKMEIVRDGEPLALDVELTRKRPEDYLIDPYMFDRGPKYFIFGGLIFQELTLPFLEAWGDEWVNRAPFRLVYANANPEPFEKEGREKLVFLSNVLETPSTLGYENINSIVVGEVNGRFIRNIRDLAEAFAAVPENGIHTIEFPDFPKVIYVDDRASKTVNQQLLQFGISQLQRLD